jgi:hypothetical protein
MTAVKCTDGFRHCLGQALVAPARENVSARRASNHVPISLKFLAVQPSEAAKDRLTGVMLLAAASY